MGAPNALRGGSHAGNLSALEGLRAGVVDGLAADYHPASLLHAAFRIHREGVLPLHQAVGLVSQNIAAMCGLEDRGRLEVGLRADLVLLRSGRFLGSGPPLFREKWFITTATWRPTSQAHPARRSP